MLANADLARTAESGQILKDRLLRNGELPQVIHYLNDAMAIGGLRALFAAKIAVPKEVSVIGFNGTSLQNSVRTRLTTFEMPVCVVGEQASRATIGAAIEQDAAQSAIFVPQIIRGNTFSWPDE